jgi:uncharacterized BrkB/YihY/UPF0761 family membrane protein
MEPTIKPSDAAFLERWKISRAQGRWRFMLVSGVLTYGLIMFVAMTFFVNGPARLTVVSVLVAAATWSVGGLVFGALVWHFSERRYKRLSSIESGSSHG